MPLNIAPVQLVREVLDLLVTDEELTDQQFDALMERYTCENLANSLLVVQTLDKVLRMVAYARVIDKDYDHHLCRHDGIDHPGGES